MSESNFLSCLVEANPPDLPGVYRMISKDSFVLYVGKAKNLKKRLKSYARDLEDIRIQNMVSQVHKIELVITKTELEALLLELKLIKSLKPKYNILLRDDKTFPYLKITIKSDFPGIYRHRTKTPNTTENQKLFGPFASSIHLDLLIKEISRIFMLRSCQDNYFKNRIRPCLQYQIKRCSAPCVSKINKEDYQFSVNQAIKFLSGKVNDVIENLNKKMLVLSGDLRYEEAAETRDRINAIKQLKLKHDLELTGIEDSDVIGIYSYENLCCLQVFAYRASQFLGNRIYFFELNSNQSIEDVLSHFLVQFYETNDIPKEIIISNEIQEQNLEFVIKEILDLHVKITKAKPNSVKRKVVEYVKYNAKIALDDKIKKDNKNNEILLRIKNLFELSELPKRIEVYDNSHIMGKYPIGVMIVLIDGVFKRSEYRKYHIKSTNIDSSGGDDYQMLREVLTRRIKRIISGESDMPNLMIIDGGLGHLNVGLEVAKNLAININMISMAKGKFRDKGGERFFSKNKNEFSLDNRDSAMKFLQVARDEAHNYAISSHRKMRDKV